MLSARRENVSSVPGHKVWRYRTRLLLTPKAVKAEMAHNARVVLTHFDRMLSDQQADVLEHWAANEQILSGKAKTQSWTHAAQSNAVDFNFQPVPDSRMMALAAHGEMKKRLPEFELEILSAFVAIQNRHEGALSTAQYGIAFFPNARNKSAAFLRAVVDAAQILVDWRY